MFWGNPVSNSSLRASYAQIETTGGHSANKIFHFQICWVFWHLFQKWHAVRYTGANYGNWERSLKERRFFTTVTPNCALQESQLGKSSTHQTPFLLVSPEFPRVLCHLFLPWISQAFANVSIQTRSSAGFSCQCSAQHSPIACRQRCFPQERKQLWDPSSVGYSIVSGSDMTVGWFLFLPYFGWH